MACGFPDDEMIGCPHRRSHRRLEIRPHLVDPLVAHLQGCDDAVRPPVFRCSHWTLVHYRGVSARHWVVLLPVVPLVVLPREILLPVVLLPMVLLRSVIHDSYGDYGSLRFPFWQRL